MRGRDFERNEDTLSIIEEIGGHMPGGFFIYKADEPEELGGGNLLLSAEDSPVRVLVIPANEELGVARKTYRIEEE